MPLLFEWDPHKARANRRKHRVNFEEASTAFGDVFSITIPDDSHSAHEKWWITMGKSNRGNLLVIVHTDRSAAIRIISARKATRTERSQYEERA